MIGLVTNTLFLAVACLALYLLAYRFYARYLGRRILALDPARKTPAHELKDGIDFVPTRAPVLFGHHFASIAGLGPILGPAIGIIWGWLPALLWVVFGTIFLGAVHDFATLVASVRHQGRTLGDLTRDLIGPRARVLFLLVSFFLIALAMGVFALNLAVLFVDIQPEAVVPTFSLILVALVVGVLVYRTRVKLLHATLVGVGLMLATTVAGVYLPVPVYRWFVKAETATAIEAAGADQAPALADTVRWSAVRDHLDTTGRHAAAADVARAATQSKNGFVVVLLFYSLLASILPVWLLLQPRDYIQ